ncbi:MAG: hypothetical protein ACHQIH_01110 [Ignavibacteria bacterium]
MNFTDYDKLFPKALSYMVQVHSWIRRGSNLQQLAATCCFFSI